MSGPLDVDEFQSISDNFLSWLQSNGATISSKVQLADLRGKAAGRGVVAKEDLGEDEELFSIPRSSILTTESSNLPSNIYADLDDPWLSLILIMVYEYLRGQDSSWKAYFDILPERFDTLMFWSDEDLQHLQGSAVVDKIGKEGANSTFSSQLLPIIAQHTDIFRAAGRSNAELLSLCHRMGSTIMAYAFDLEKPSADQANSSIEEWEEEQEDVLPKGMVPLADMLNADADHNNAKLFYQDDCVVMKTIKSVPAASELYNDFGPLPRADLLRRYGYVTEQYARYDLVEVSSDSILARAKDQLQVSSENDLFEKWTYAEEQGILDDAYDIGRADSEEGPFPEELCVLLNLLVTPTAEFEKMTKKDKLPKPEWTSEAKRLLRSVLVYRYAEYPPAKTSREIFTGRPGMAQQVVNGERELLQEAINTVSDTTSKKRAADTLDDEVAAIRNPTKK